MILQSVFLGSIGGVLKLENATVKMPLGRDDTQYS